MMLIIGKKGNKYPLYINYMLSIVLDILQLFILKSSKQFYKTVKLTKLVIFTMKIVLIRRYWIQNKISMTPKSLSSLCIKRINQLECVGWFCM